MTEVDMTSYLNRAKMTELFATRLTELLEHSGFLITELGWENVLRDSKKMRSLIHKRVAAKVYKKSPAALMVKFMPDCLGIYPQIEGDKGIFLFDAKISITPVFFPKHIERIRRSARLPELRREDAGEIEREAWDVYNEFYPKARVAIFLASPYHPRLIVGEWVSKTLCIYRHRRDRLPESGGSGTPPVNIHLGKMRSIEGFLEDEFGVRLGSPLRELKEFIKTWVVSKPPGRVNWTQYNNAIRELRERCPWLRERRPTKIDPAQISLKDYGLISRK